MRSDKIPVTTDVLVWARTTAGYDQESAARKVGVSLETLLSIESGEKMPSIVQLRKMAEKYKRPLAVLLLGKPPKDFSVPHDYRRLSSMYDNTWSPKLISEYKRALSQRDVLTEIDEVAPGTAIIDDKKAYSIPNTTIDVAGEKFRRLLRIDSWSTDTRKNLNSAIDTLEALGILVVQAQRVPIAEMRGMSVSKWLHPIIILNGADYPRPKLFSLLHELAHIGSNMDGLCDMNINQSKDVVNGIERKCNQIAAASLMPKDVIFRDPEIINAKNWNTDTVFAEHGHGFCCCQKI